MIIYFSNSKTKNTMQTKIQNFRTHFLTTALVIVFLLNSCSKSNEVPDNSAAIKDFSAETLNYNGVNSGRVSQAMPVTTILQSIDYVQLQAIQNSGDTLAVEEFFLPYAKNIAEAIGLKYNVNLRAEYLESPSTMMVLGMCEFGVENGITSIDSVLLRASDPYSCFVAAVTGAIGISDMQSIYNDFVNGVSPKTVFGALRKIARRTLWGISVAFLIVDVAICLDWV